MLLHMITFSDPIFVTKLQSFDPPKNIRPKPSSQARPASSSQSSQQWIVQDPCPLAEGKIVGGYLDLCLYQPHDKISGFKNPMCLETTVMPHRGLKTPTRIISSERQELPRYCQDKSKKGVSVHLQDVASLDINQMYSKWLKSAMFVCRSWVIKNSFPHPLPHPHPHHDLLMMYLSMIRFPCLHDRPGSDCIRIALVHPQSATSPFDNVYMESESWNYGNAGCQNATAGNNPLF